LGRATPTCDDFFYRAGQRELVAPVPNRQEFLI